MISATPLLTFVDSLAPAPFDRTTASRRREALKAELGASPLNVAFMFESGSWSHGTALKGHSDVDYMAVAASRRPMLPSSALRVAKDSIDTYRISAYKTRISSPTVKIEYYASPYVEVVPAWISRLHREEYVYWIPGPNDSWVESAPKAHLRFVSEQNDRLSKKVKPLVRLIKQWKLASGAPVSSFYLEMRTAAYARGEARIAYEIDALAVFQELIDHGLRSMNDPVGVVTRINAVSSEDNRRATLGLLRTAEANLSQAAKLTKNSRNAATYYSLMTEVFGQDFPYPMWQ